MAEPLRVLGLMSGTSLDAIDAALVDIAVEDDGLGLTILATGERPWPTELRERLAGWADGVRVPTPADIAATSMEVGEALAVAGEAVVRAVGHDPGSIDLVASHGQTLAHAVSPTGTVLGTLQIGEPAVIAERTGRTVVADFRPRDVAAGGQGAPLVSFVDALLAGATSDSVAFLNLGGVANVSVVPGGDPGAALAWDTGPGNAVIDALARRLLGAASDLDGAVAASGRVDGELVDELISYPYFARRPPKSTGRDEFGERFAAALVDRGERSGLGVPDLVATATELTARSVADQLRRFAPDWPRTIYTSGGGTANPTLLHGLEAALSSATPPGRATPVLAGVGAFGIPSEAKEAIAFAVLGHETLHGRPNSLPGCTGARHPSVLGAIWPGSNYRGLLERVMRSRPDRRIVRLRVDVSEAPPEGGSG